MDDKKRHNNPPRFQDRDKSGREETSQQKDPIINKENKQTPGNKPERTFQATGLPGSDQWPAHLTFLTLEGKWSPGAENSSGRRTQQGTSEEKAELNNLLRVLAYAEAPADSAPVKTNSKETGQEDQSTTGMSEEGILIIDAGGRIIYANAGAGEILGAPAERLVDRVLVKTDFTIANENKERKEENSYTPMKYDVTGNLPADGIVGIIRTDGTIGWTKTQSHHLLEKGKITGSQTAILLKQLSLDHYPGTLENSMNETITEQLHTLEKVNQELEDFNYSISHDLKSHIFVIEGYCSFIEEEYFDELNEDIIKCLHKIRARALTMKNLLDALLRLSKITDGTLKREELCLSDIAQNILNDFNALEPWRDASISVQPGQCELCDPNLTHTALYNLLDNAWKYTANNPHTVIEFGAEEHGKEKIFFVRDNGVGFDMKDAENIFKPFKRLRSEPEYRGTGIGLVTVRKIVQRHEGRIWVESEVGKGATFYFTMIHSNE